MKKFFVGRCKFIVARFGVRGSGEGRMEKGEWRRESGEGGREKGEGRVESAAAEESGEGRTGGGERRVESGGIERLLHKVLCVQPCNPRLATRNPAGKK